MRGGPPYAADAGASCATAITRARELLIVVGDEDVLAAMARNDRRQQATAG
ncbi:MAG: hypothetical protein ACLR8L_00390 [Oscillospiraceae bacterium]